MPIDDRATPSRGWFITFEGGEGSGKTTQIERLATSLRDQGYSVVATREPGGSAGADALRHIILTGDAEALGNEMETILFAAARLDHLATLIEPALRRGDFVLCDRFQDSTRVYQGSTEGADPDFMSIVEEATLAGARPDMTIILDIPSEEGLRRASLRRGEEAADRFEKESIEVHEARRQAFLAIARAEPDRCEVIDASQPVDAVSNDVLKLVLARLNLPGAGQDGSCTTGGRFMIDLEPVQGHDDIDDVTPPAATLRLRSRVSEWSELIGAFQSGRMHHAWLMQGPRGVGKATTAFAFARWVLGGAATVMSHEGSGPVFDPEHPAVRQIAQGSHPNLIHLSRPPADRTPGFKTQITVDEIRRLNQFFRATAGGSWRIAIIDPADDMNRSAANALLKTLEEPPERSLFLIANHAPGRLLPTIRSRCRVLRFEPLDEAAVSQALHATLPDAALEDITAAARLGNGSLRDAFLMLTSGGLEVEASVERLYRSPQPDWSSIQSLADALTQKGREAAWALFLDALSAKLSADAVDRAKAGDRRGADALAALWEREGVRWREAAAFNLDRKQMLLTFFAGLSAVREEMAG